MEAFSFLAEAVFSSFGLRTVFVAGLDVLTVDGDLAETVFSFLRWSTGVLTDREGDESAGSCWTRSHEHSSRI